MDKDNIIMSIYVAAEEVGTGHVYSDGATLTILLFFFLRWLFLEFWTISAGTNRRAERSSE